MKLVALVCYCNRLKGPGVILMFEWTSPPAAQLCAGDEVQLRSPNGDVTDVVVGTVVDVRPPADREKRGGVWLQPPWGNQEFPRNTEIWTKESSPRSTKRSSDAH